MSLKKSLCDVSQWLRLSLFSKCSIGAFFLALYSAAAYAQTGGKMPDFYKEPGLQPNRDFVNQHFGEHIDPFTGALQLHYTDIHIPGNGGFDLNVQRSYNSASVDKNNPKQNSNMGVGWSLHFGRVTKAGSDGICTNDFDTSTDNPVVEMPDGSAQRLYFTSSGSPLALTTRRWKAECIFNSSNPGLIIYATDGTKYTMNKQVAEGSFEAPVFAYYTTLIEDRNGNTMTVSYNSSNTAMAELTSVTRASGGSVSFSYTGTSNTTNRRISSITGTSGTWNYSYQEISSQPGRFQLTGVSRPASGSWSYSYNSNTTAGAYVMSGLTMPQGGGISYSWTNVSVDSSSGRPVSMVSGKNAGGSSWSWSYSPATSNGSQDSTTVSTPSGTHTYRHWGPNGVGNGEVWKIGLLTFKSISTVQNESYSWSNVIVVGEPNSREGLFSSKQDSDTLQPVMTRKEITRGGTTFTTDYSSFDSYGNPTSISEAGPGGSRSTSVTYLNSTSKWIIGLIEDESRNGGQSVSRSYDTDGNLTSISRDGVSYSYSYNGDGTVNSMTDPRGNSTTYGSYVRGIPESESQPGGVSISRSVGGSGNILSESVGGQSFSYTYDGINRVTSIGYPSTASSNVSISYGSASKTATRGGLTESTTYNGYGYVSGITLGGITRSFSVDSLGRRTFESNPNGSASGTSFTYDALNRVRGVTYADGSTRSHSYGGSSMTVTDERGFATTYSYRSYGDPSFQALTGISSPQQATTISRNSRDLISAVTQGSLTRSYGYNGNYFLTSITDPETGNTTYGRDGMGNMTSRVVGGSGTTSYTYDGQNRVTSVTYPGGLTIGKTYNQRGKVLTANSSGTGGDRSYGYDSNDNLTTETLTVDGQSFTASYGYTSLDQLSSITYPKTGRTVSYAPNALGRPTQVGGYATGVSYHASGLVSGITYGNTATSTYAQNARLWPSSFVTTRGSGITSATYTYDGTGNLTTLTDTLDTRYNRTLGYDGIGRLTSASGPWGSGTIAYDGVGNITSATYGGSALNYSYDSNNRLSTLSGTGGARSASYSYGNYGTIVSDGAAGALNTNTYQYDGVPNLTCINCADATKKIEHVYDGNHTRVAVKKNSVSASGSSTATTYEFHSARGQLLLEYTPSENEQTTEHIYLGDKRIAQRSNNNRTASTRTCAFEISGDGDVDAGIDGLLIARYALGFRGAALIAGITASPALDASVVEARLLSLTSVASGAPAGTKSTLDIDGDGTVLATTDALMILRSLRALNGSTDASLANDAFNPSGTRNTTALIQAYIATICEKNPIPAGESISYFHNDIGGTPQAATDSAGNVLWKESYKPYGERTTNAIATQGGKGNNEVYFHGKKAETQLNGGVTLQYFGARYYDPSGARFMSIDPVGFSEGNIHSFNRYAYGNNNPFKFVDPDGRSPESPLMDQVVGDQASVDVFRGMMIFGETLTVVVPAAQLVRGGVALYRAGRAAGAAEGAAEGANFAASAARGRTSEARVLQEMGLTKNTQSVVSAEGKAIPDALTRTTSIEIKDAQRVNLTKQLRIQTEAAKASGRDSILVTGEKTCVSAPCSGAFSQIIRRTDLGPK
jgi:RHS repeat-associated protein